jgi:multidrug efflux pump subunit AcrA (membrane-fusion protein)
MKNAFSALSMAPALVAACLVAAACRQQQSDDEENRSAVRAVVSVQTGRVVEAPATDRIAAFGHTDALKKEKLYAPLAGRIVSLRAFEGTATRKGDTIAVIETKESESALRGAESILQSAKTPAQRAEGERMLELARTSRNSIAVKAKFDGYVSTRTVSEGELVAENAELMTIVDLATVDFIAEVGLRDLPSIAAGQQASVTFPAMPGFSWAAAVVAINPQSDPQSQTVHVRIEFIKHMEPHLRAMLRTAMNGSAFIVTGTRAHALFAPKAALLRDDVTSTYAVVTVTKDSLALRIPVRIGTTTDSTVEVSGEGIAPGVVVITTGQYALADSTRVTTPP